VFPAGAVDVARERGNHVRSLVAVPARLLKEKPGNRARPPGLKRHWEG